MMRPPTRRRGLTLCLLAALAAGDSGSSVAAEPAAGPVAPVETPRKPGRADYRAMIEAESAGVGLPAEIAEAVMAVESGYDPAAIGGVGEIGLMQVLPSTARMMGFAGTDAELAKPEINIRYGVTYLAGAWRKGGQDICTAAMKYRAGHGEHRFSHKSVAYCLAVRSRLAARGYAVTGVVPAATFGEPSGSFASARGRASRGGCRGMCLKGSSGGAELTALNRRLDAMVVSVRVIRLGQR